MGTPPVVKPDPIPLFGLAEESLRGHTHPCRTVPPSTAPVARCVATGCRATCGLPSVLPMWGFTDMSRWAPADYSAGTQRDLHSKPSSRTALRGEQHNPWDLLQPQDAMSRHRGAKPSRRYGLLGKMSLLSPGYLLSVERRRFHTLPPDHYALLSHLLDVSVSQSSSLVSLHSTTDCQPV